MCALSRSNAERERGVCALSKANAERERGVCAMSRANAERERCVRAGKKFILEIGNLFLPNQLILDP